MNCTIREMEPVFSEAGSRFQPVYSSKVLNDGSVVLKEVGKDDIYARIQSYKESTDIAVILKRFQNGDRSVLSKVQGFYADVTGAPKTYAQMLQAVIDGQALFDGLPADMKREFNNDFFSFFTGLGSQEWLAKINKFVDIPSPVPEPTPTVPDNENIP